VNRRMALVLCILGLAVTACGSGRNAQVLQEDTAINGVNANLPGGNVVVRNVYATPTDLTQSMVPAGGSVTLHFRVYNSGSQPELMVAQPPAELSGTGVVAGAVAIPANGDVWVGGPTSQVTGVIAHIPQAAWIGTYVPLTLQFNNAGHVDLIVPVEDALLTES
jgi:hypothetical protein